jgi:hypothetical protein
MLDSATTVAPLAVLGMGTHAVVTLIAVALALAVIASYLIKIALILWNVIDRLRVILGAVVAVAENSRPMEPVMNDINRDLDAARDAFEGAVKRLEQRRGPAEREVPAGAEQVSPSWRHWGAGGSH